MKQVPLILLFALAMFPALDSIADNIGSPACREQLLIEKPEFEKPVLEHVERPNFGIEKPLFEKREFQKPGMVAPQFEKAALEKPIFDTTSLQRDCFVPQKKEAAKDFTAFPKPTYKKWAVVPPGNRRLYTPPSHQLKHRQSPYRR